MAFGWSVGDVLKLLEISWSIFEAFQDGLQNAPNQFRALADQFGAFHKVLDQLQDVLKRHDKPLYFGYRSVETTLEKCQLLLDKYRALATLPERKLSTFAVQRLYRTIRWPFTEKVSEKLQDELAGHARVLTLYIASLNLESSFEDRTVNLEIRAQQKELMRKLDHVAAPNNVFLMQQNNTFGHVPAASFHSRQGQSSHLTEAQRLQQVERDLERFRSLLSEEERAALGFGDRGTMPLLDYESDWGSTQTSRFASMHQDLQTQLERVDNYKKRLQIGNTSTQPDTSPSSVGWLSTHAPAPSTDILGIHVPLNRRPELLMDDLSVFRVRQLRQFAMELETTPSSSERSSPLIRELDSRFQGPPREISPVVGLEPEELLPPSKATNYDSSSHAASPDAASPDAARVSPRTRPLHSRTPSVEPISPPLDPFSQGVQQTFSQTQLNRVSTFGSTSYHVWQPLCPIEKFRVTPVNANTCGHCQGPCHLVLSFMRRSSGGLTIGVKCSTSNEVFFAHMIPSSGLTVPFIFNSKADPGSALTLSFKGQQTGHVRLPQHFQKYPVEPRYTFRTLSEKTDFEELVVGMKLLRVFDIDVVRSDLGLESRSETLRIWHHEESNLKMLSTHGDLVSKGHKVAFNEYESSFAPFVASDFKGKRVVRLKVRATTPNEEPTRRPSGSSICSAGSALSTCRTSISKPLKYLEFEFMSAADRKDFVECWGPLTETH